MQIAKYLIAKIVSNALAEDLNNDCDYSSLLLDQTNIVSATIITREEMVLCGEDFATLAFMLLDDGIEISWNYKAGDKIAINQVLCTVKGRARAILSAERTALNFLQTMSATATLVRQFVDKVKGLQVKIMDTRKTIPGLRVAQKYAVLVGGGYNQRIGLYDGVLIKENHISASGGVRQALTQAFSVVPKHIPIQIEVENHQELGEAIAAGAKLILLDNMSVEDVATAVKMAAGSAQLEASGNINLDNVRDYAITGVDRISIGGLTKNIKAIDLSLRVEGL